MNQAKGIARIYTARRFIGMRTPRILPHAFFILTYLRRNHGIKIKNQLVNTVVCKNEEGHTLQS